MDDVYLAELRDTKKMGQKKKGGPELAAYLSSLEQKSAQAPDQLSASELKAWERVAELESLVSRLETKIMHMEHEQKKQPQRIQKSFALRGRVVETVPQLREMMVDLYNTHNPAKLEHVDDVLGQLVGQETKLVDALRDKYPTYFGPNDQHIAQSSGGGRENGEGRGGSSSNSSSLSTSNGGSQSHPPRINTEAEPYPTTRTSSVSVASFSEAEAEAEASAASAASSSPSAPPPAPEARPTSPPAPLPTWREGRQRTNPSSSTLLASTLGYKPHHDELADARQMIAHWELMARQALHVLLLNPTMNDFYASELSSVLRDVLLSLPQIETVQYIRCSFPAIEQQAPHLVLEHWESLANGEWRIEWHPTWAIEICVEGSAVQSFSTFTSFKLLVNVTNFHIKGFLQTIFKPDLSEVRLSFPQMPLIEIPITIDVTWGSLALPIQGVIGNLIRDAFSTWLTDSLVAPNSMVVPVLGAKKEAALTDADLDKALKAANDAGRIMKQITGVSPRANKEGEVL